MSYKDRVKAMAKLETVEEPHIRIVCGPKVVNMPWAKSWRQEVPNAFEVDAYFGEFRTVLTIEVEQEAVQQQIMAILIDLRKTEIAVSPTYFRFLAPKKDDHPFFWEEEHPIVKTWGRLERALIEYGASSPATTHVQVNMLVPGGNSFVTTEEGAMLVVDVPNDWALKLQEAYEYTVVLNQSVIVAPIWGLPVVLTIHEGETGCHFTLFADRVKHCSNYRN